MCSYIINICIYEFIYRDSVKRKVYEIIVLVLGVFSSSLVYHKHCLNLKFRFKSNNNCSLYPPTRIISCNHNNHNHNIIIHNNTVVMVTS